MAGLFATIFLQYLTGNSKVQRKNSKLYELLCPALKQIMKKHQTVQVVQGQIIYNYSKYVRNMIASYNERSI